MQKVLKDPYHEGGQKTFKKKVRGILVSFQSCFGNLYTFQPKKCPVGLKKKSKQ
jgi:hypothetical protein